MEYTSRTVRSNEPGLTQEQALRSLYSHYGDTIRIASVKRRGDSWVVRFDQRTAEFPPKDDDEEDNPIPSGKQEKPGTPPDSAPSDDAGDGEDALGPDDGPGPDDGDGDSKGPEAEVLHLLHEIAQALGISGGLDDKMPPEGDMGGPPPPGPGDDMGGPDMGGPPAGPGGPPGAAPKKPTKLRPGEVLPNQTPIGAPAFASTKRTIEVESGQVDPREVRASQAEADLNEQFGAQGFTVRQLKFDRTASVYRALLSNH